MDKYIVGYVDGACALSERKGTKCACHFSRVESLGERAHGFLSFNSSDLIALFLAI